MPSRRDRLTRQIEELMPSWSMAPVAAALQTMRGAERGIRPIALNRKNALFAGSERKTASDSAEPMAE
jgi:hypothetical protein